MVPGIEHGTWNYLTSWWVCEHQGGLEMFRHTHSHVTAHCHDGGGRRGGGTSLAQHHSGDRATSSNPVDGRRVRGSCRVKIESSSVCACVIASQQFFFGKLVCVVAHMQQAHAGVLRLRKHTRPYLQHTVCSVVIDGFFGNGERWPTEDRILAVGWASKASKPYTIATCPYDHLYTPRAAK